MLDNRLKMCAEFVSGKGIAVDVGTDHAHLAAELILSGKCERVIASDVKEGPLEAARSTVEKHGIGDKVELILSDGLENVPLSGVTDIIIAGMGGETIADIIDGCMEKDWEVMNFILQPMTKPEILRKKLYTLGLRIVTEKVVEDGDKLYVVMCARLNEGFDWLTEAETIRGFFDENDPLAKKYRKRESERLQKVSEALEKAGKQAEAVHYRALATKTEQGAETMDIREIVAYLDGLYPLSAQEKWDNSGLLVERYTDECSKVLLTLDITNRVVAEAADKSAELIISHHPVIFEPLKKIGRRSPVFQLISSDIAALCMHTNLDIAEGGTNGVILRKLRERFELACEPQPFEDCGGGNTLGWIVELKESVKPDELGEILKDIFGCEYVRRNRIMTNRISKIAFCSGSGGSMLELALEKGVDAYITGDVKHDVWIEANNRRIGLFDCGHFHTENLVLTELRSVLEEQFPRLDVEIAERSIDPVVYI